MKRMNIMYLAFLPLLFLVFTGCSAKKKEESNIVKIGSILPLTGGAAVYGEYAKAGQLKALGQVNKDLKDMKIEIIFEDGKGDPKESINAYQKLRRDGVNIFVTTLSPVCLAILPLAKADQVLLFADAAHPAITAQKSPFIFRHSNTADEEAGVIISRLVQKKYKNVGILYVNDDYGKVLSTQLGTTLNKMNVRTVVEPYEKTQSDFSVVVQKIKSWNIGAVVLIGSAQNMGLAIKKMREMNYTGDIIANIGYSIMNAKKLSGSNLANVEFVNFDFSTDANDSLGGNISAFEVLEFGTIKLLGAAIKEKGNDIQKIIKHLSSVTEFSSGSEVMKLTKNNDIIPKLKIEHEIQH